MPYSSVWMSAPLATVALMIGWIVDLLHVGQHVQNYPTTALDESMQTCGGDHAAAFVTLAPFAGRKPG